LSQRTFIFDIGMVLIDYDFRVLAARLADDPDQVLPVLDALRRDPTHVEVESGRMSGPEYFREVIRPLAPHWTYRDLVAAWGDAFTLNPHGMRVFQALRDRGLPVYLMSNLADFNAEAIAEKFPGFFASSSGNFLSYEMGHMKPEPEIYLQACARIGVTPEQCLFLDDTPACVEGARRVGMPALQFSVARIDAIRDAVAAAAQCRLE
jgi:FMN phosphatase YigB (HAD superfamily)